MAHLFHSSHPQARRFAWNGCRRARTIARPFQDFVGPWKPCMTERRLLRCLLALGLALGGGCQSFGLLPATEKNRKHVRPDKDAVALPSKDQFRVSQYVFNSDTEIKRDLPL